MSDKLDSFQRAWFPKGEYTSNVVGTAKERGARALLQQDDMIKTASWNTSVGTAKEAAFDETFYNPGPEFKRLALDC